MFICELCKREFKSPQSFSAHLTHPKSACKTNVKEYYDRYLKKPDEGICKHCRKETGFCSILKGYLNNICGRCKNIDEAIIEKQKLSRISTYRERQEKYEQEHKDEIEQEKSKLTVSCELCKEQGIDYKFKHLNGLSKHIWQKHNHISTKDYYDKYLKKEGDNICTVTGKETRFKNLTEEYFKFSGKGTNSVVKDIDGEKNPLWNPNREEVFAPYTEKFSNLEFRNQIKKEQNYIDVVTEQQLVDRCCLHHIDYDKQNDSRENLIWLNHSTHAKTNSNRDEWKQLLQKINNEIISNII
jgi:hypothetical protein